MSASSSSRRLALVGVIALAACGDSPASPPLTVGTFALERVDAALLPVQISLPVGECVVERGTFQLFPNATFSWTASCATPVIPPQKLGGFGIDGSFRQVTGDSLDLFSRFGTTRFASVRVVGRVLSVYSTSSTPYAGTHTWSFGSNP